MNREIKFRGKQKGYNTWIFGSLIISRAKTEYWIAPLENECLADSFNHAEMVDPKTVGQYTGLKDKNGKEIYEGDVCTTSDNSNILIEYKEVNASFNLIGVGFTFYGYNNDLEVIGNIHENKELIKKENNG